MKILFIPEKIVIGFVEDKKAMTGKLAYVIYYDEKKKLRKEVSWQNWRDKSIDPIEMDNIPKNGFLINREVDHRAYDFGQDRVRFRIHAPNDFEFEITPLNISYILSVSNINMREIVEKCVFAWDGKELVLLPVNSQHYIDAVKSTNMIKNFKATTSEVKELKFGDILHNKSGDLIFYLGKKRIPKYKDVIRASRNCFTKNSDGEWEFNSIIKEEDFALPLIKYKVINGYFFHTSMYNIKKINLKNYIKSEKKFEDLEFAGNNTEIAHELKKAKINFDKFNIKTEIPMDSITGKVTIKLRDCKWLDNQTAYSKGSGQPARPEFHLAISNKMTIKDSYKVNEDIKEVKIFFVSALGCIVDIHGKRGENDIFTWNIEGEGSEVHDLSVEDFGKLCNRKYSYIKDQSDVSIDIKK